MVFGLVHGGMHGAWCWDKLIPELEALGHRAVAVDLPCEDPALGALDQARFVADAFADLPPDMTLLSHSIGALVGALVPGLRPVARTIFLCSPLPDIGRSLVDQLQHDGVSVVDTVGQADIDADQRTTYRYAVARHLLFDDCPEETARWAFERLRPQSTLVMREITPLREWPPIPHHYILARDDRQLAAAWARRVVPERLATKPVEIPGGHSPFLSRPALLARILDGLARDGEGASAPR